MKRASVATIDTFFASQAAKQTVSEDLLNPPPRQPMSIVRITPEKKLRKVTIPALATSTRIPTEKFEEIWSELKTGVEQLFDCGVESVNFMKMYRDVEFYCRFGKMKDLHQNLEGLVGELIEKLIGSIGPDMDLAEISALLSKFEENSVNLRKVFLCLDRLYIFANRVDGYMSILDLVHDMARKQFLANSSLVDVIIQKVRFQIQLMRCDQSDASSALKNVLSFLVSLNLYDEYFVPVFFEQTEEFFGRISEELTLEQFLQWYSMAMEKEKELFACGIKETTMSIAYKLIRKVCLEDHADRIFGHEFARSIEENISDVVRTVYEYFDSDDIRHLFNERFGNYFCEKIEQSIKDGKDASSLVEIYRGARVFVDTAFGEMSPLVNVVRNAVEKGLATESATVAKLLAQYFDQGLPITQYDGDILAMCHARDVFEALYRYKLSQRILSWTDIDIPREQELIRVFKAAAGADYTERFERMLKDLVEAKSVTYQTDNFRQMIVSNLAFGVGVLEEDAIFPKEIQDHMDRCANAFVGDRNNMIVRWSATLTTVHMLINDIECIMSGDQALILLSMARGLDTAEKIAAETGITQDTVSNNLVVFQKKRAGHVVLSKDDRFILNPNVKFDKEPPIRFPASSLASLERDQSRIEGNEEYIMQNRIMCAIVEKMKIFKQMKLSELKQTVQKVLQSTVDTTMFMQAIKQLEDKFIEKSGERSYRYLTA